jgi:hypothetical protein
MNGINRQGQRIRCIQSVSWGTSTGVRGSPGPHEGGEYTVESFIPVVINGAEYPACTLKEIVTPTCSCCEAVLGWPLACFRPIVDDEAKNKHVEELIALLKAPTPANAIEAWPTPISEMI